MLHQRPGIEQGWFGTEQKHKWVLVYISLKLPSLRKAWK